jgi:hypothetical protein
MAFLIERDARMTTAERIQKIGFKRWYERTLIESHAYFVTAFLGMIVAVAGIELIGQRGAATRVLLGFLAAILGTALVGFGIHRYYRILLVAEGYGDRATCPQCRTYASFNIVAVGDAAADPTWLRVKCRKCRNEWTM